MRIGTLSDHEPMPTAEPRAPPPYEVINNCVLPRTLRYYVEDDVWARVDDGRVTLGWTDSSQTVTGSILYVDFRSDPGEHLDTGAPIATVEAAKWMGVVRAPFTGTLTGNNEAIKGRHGVVHPVNRSPYNAGWIATLEPEAPVDESLAAFLPIDEAIDAYREKIDRLGLDACVHCDSFEI